MVVNLRVRSGGGLHLSVTSTTGTEVAWLGLSSISDFTGEYCQTGPILPCYRLRLRLWDEMAFFISRLGSFSYTGILVLKALHNSHPLHQPCLAASVVRHSLQAGLVPAVLCWDLMPLSTVDSPVSTMLCLDSKSNRI